MMLAAAAPVLIADQAAETGAALYASACAACHGANGKGLPQSVVGFDTPLPDFTDCGFTTSEADVDWSAVVHDGGPARALDRRMPAFGAALSHDQIQSAIDYIRGFCTRPAWPHGNLNLPRALVTGKAFPENEAFARMAMPVSKPDFVETQVVYERRIGPRSQYEVAVPFNARYAFGQWNRGLGDITVGFKQVLVQRPARGSIFSAGTAMTFPTGKEVEGLGQRLTVFEPFGAFSQMLPSAAFVHVQLGFEVPLNIATANNEFYWRAAVGKTLVEDQWGRAWSPMVEVLVARELEFGALGRWDVLPQVQVTLSRRQHIAASGGVRVPLNLRISRRPTVMFQVLWDWVNGGISSGW
jgi:hypothetical protein